MMSGFTEADFAGLRCEMPLPISREIDAGLAAQCQTGQPGDLIAV